MAELNARIIPKASGTAGEVPLASDLETAELAVNTADGTLFTKDTAGAVVTISGGGSGGVASIIAGDGISVDQATGDVTIMATGGERGDGGDLDFGTIDSGFVFGVYGGGDWDTGSVDIPEEYYGDHSPDGGDFT